MTETDELVKTMREQAKTYVNATCDFTALESEWVEMVTKHNQLVKDERPGFTEWVEKNRFEELFKYLDKKWGCDCNCEHLDQNSDRDKYWDDLKETSCETLRKEVKKGQCKCDFITTKFEEAKEGTRPLIETLKERLALHGVSLHHGV